MKKFKKLLLEFIVAVMLSLSIPGMAMAADAGVPGAMCQSAGVWQGLIKNICWSCIFPMRIMGIGAAPEGAAPSRPGCYCTDQNGVPEIGWQLSFFQPVKIVEVVKSPWCSPFLEGTMLQKSQFDIGKSNTGTVAKLAMRQPFVLFKGLTFQKLCLPGAFRPGDHHNK
ncbi:TraU family protein, partial [Escherichia coli]|uniref:TraU family protein n=1 Tax=Escherichia coli TaxID=562 RepID=UPI0021C0EA06